MACKSVCTLGPPFTIELYTESLKKRINTMDIIYSFSNALTCFIMYITFRNRTVQNNPLSGRIFCIYKTVAKERQI
jgi:hypothetical protein